MYLDSNGKTAAFNKGAAVFFDLDVFLGQVLSSGWQFNAVLGSNMQHSRESETRPDSGSRIGNIELIQETFNKQIMGTFAQSSICW